ncbi:MAG: L-2-amino-thiazoline-4-carboxylic acid hydrolase [Candidatus Cryosericum sp.]
MDDMKIRERFSAQHHALLFAWITREVVVRVGETVAAPVLRAAVRSYGEQRGHRMALRAQQDGQPLSMAVYLSYREWQAGAGEMQQTGVPWRGDLRVNVHRCCWATTWRQEELIPYGKYYCQEIDKALVRGFNPELLIDVRGTMTNGARACQLVYHGAFEGTVVHEETQRPPERRVLPWSYHTAHLYATVSQVLKRELGSEGTAARQAGLDVFASHFGVHMAQIIVTDATGNFDLLPEEG